MNGASPSRGGQTGRSCPTAFAVALFATLVAAAPAAGYALPPPPPNLPAPSTCASVSALPHAVSVGASITGRVGPGTGGCTFKTLSWNWFANGVRVTTCATDSTVCTIKTTRPTSGWKALCIVGAGSSGGLTACDYVAVLPRGIFDLSGTVASSQNLAIRTLAPSLPEVARVAGLTVTARGAGGAVSTVTDAAGNYALAVPRGTYKVSVTPRPVPKLRLTTTPASKRVTIAKDTTGVDFLLGATRTLTGELTAIGAPHIGGQEYSMRFLAGMKVIGRSLKPFNCNGLAIHFVQCSGGPMAIAGIEGKLYFSIEWPIPYAPMSVAGELAAGPMRGDSDPTEPDPFPSSQAIGELSVNTPAPAFGGRLHRRFAVTIDFY